MKILFLTDITENTGSWIGRYKPIIKELSNNGHTVRTLLPKERSKGRIHEVISKDTLVEYTGNAFFNSKRTTREYYSTLKLFFIAIVNLFLFIKKGLITKFDLIFVGKPLPVSSTAALILSVLKRKPIHLDCDDYEVYTNQTNSRLQYHIIRIFEDYFPRFCKTITTHNKFLEERLKNIKGSKENIFYIPNGIDTERLSTSFLKEDLPELNNSAKKILYFGDLNLSTGHSVDILLEAFKIIKNIFNEKNVFLIIVGDGKDFKYLHNLAEDLEINRTIYWAGRVDPNKISKYIKLADVVVDPVNDCLGNISRCPLKILEAMYIGIPVVTSDVGDRKCFLKEEGVYAKVGNPEDLAKKILYILKDKKLQSELSKKLKLRAKKYKWDSLTKDFERILETTRRN